MKASLFLLACLLTLSSCRETLIDYAINEVGKRAFNKLLSGMSKECDSGECVFDDILLSYPLRSPLFTEGDGKGNDEKVMIRSQFVRKPCVVYGIGIANNAKFEDDMAKDCETHAFDCTISADEGHVKGRKFVFHPVCIGPKNEPIAHTVYGQLGETKDLATQMTKFQTLHKTMQVLGHKYVDIFKMDIEGGEWTVFQSMLNSAAGTSNHHSDLAGLKSSSSTNNTDTHRLLQYKEYIKEGYGVLQPLHVDMHRKHNRALQEVGEDVIDTLPQQLLMEIHTKWASPKAVPPELVRDADKQAVNSLFMMLFKLGYRVVNKEINIYDHACAEFSLVRIRTGY